MVAFAPPTISEIQEYVKAHNLTIDPEAFFHHYEANGWVQGSSKKPVKKWQSCCHTWQRNQGKFGGAATPDVSDAEHTESIRKSQDALDRRVAEIDRQKALAQSK